MTIHESVDAPRKKRTSTMGILTVIALICATLGFILLTVPVMMAGGVRELAEDSGYVAPARVSETYSSQEVTDINLGNTSHYDTVEFIQSPDDRIHITYLEDQSNPFIGFASQWVIVPELNNQTIQLKQQEPDFNLEFNFYKGITAQFDELDRTVVIEIPEDWTGRIAATGMGTTTFVEFTTAATIEASGSYITARDMTFTGDVQIDSVEVVVLESINAQRLIVNNTSTIEAVGVSATEIVLDSYHDLQVMDLDAPVITLNSDYGYIMATLPRPLDQYWLDISSRYSVNELVNANEYDTVWAEDEFTYLYSGSSEYLVPSDDPRVSEEEYLNSVYTPEAAWAYISPEDQALDSAVSLKVTARFGHVILMAEDDPKGRIFTELMEYVEY